MNNNNDTSANKCNKTKANDRNQTNVTVKRYYVMQLL